MLTDLITYVDWQFWLITLIGFALIEVFSLSLISLWFVIGALTALILALLGVTQTIQIIVFLAVSVICLLLFLFVGKPRLNKTINATEKTNADRIIDQEGLVIETINPLENTGLIRVRGQIWSARTYHDQVIEKDSLVLVKEIKGVKAVVEFVEKENI